ncbi:F-box/LRR-repeat protein At4g14103-like isoform X1 [Papaver somniferum]|uniref:F-box/LRR-repeat protein At4g14103-like isoform X1 n=2 Tax=Papaver somniferum TaxID=3469 RepID=UPI000E70063B|nr:F-box/LRR-repeat protein At4g14103-like isoform X1 [Papaver somniferum]
MIDDDDIDFGPDLTNIFSEVGVDMLQRTPPTHESNSLETNSDNEGKVFEDFTELKDDPQINTGFEFMESSKLHCSSYNEQSLGCAESGEGSELWGKKGSEDRISELPDALIHHIFSFLDMKYVVQTSVLSRRWRYLWSSLRTIEVVDIPFIKAGDAYEVTFNRFINFVDRLLLLRESSDIQSLNLVWLTVKLHLDVIGRYDIASRISTWIMAAVKHNIQELRLLIFACEIIKLPDCLFTCKSLTKFVFCGAGVEHTGFLLPDTMHFPHLRYLALSGVTLADENTLISKFFSSCPVLESLLLIDCSIHFDFSSLSLKHFQLDNCDTSGPTDTTVKLCAPNLISIICKDYMSQDYFLENLSSLVTADIGIRVKYADEDPKPEMLKIYSELATDVKELYRARMIKLLRAVRNVTDLRLSSSPVLLEVVSGSLDLLAGDPYFQFCNLRFLKVVTWVSRNCMNVIAYLVKISPNIESIFLTIEQSELNTNNTGGDWIVGSSSFPCLHYLKFVQIQGIQGCLNELKLLQVLLKKAVVLEKVTLFCSETDSPDRAAQLVEFKEMLLAYPSASSSVSISIQS